jgi:leader peptidase (prepilin peptidase) / N-methyltransferase
MFYSLDSLLILFSLFAVGLAVGSFLNVCILRIPSGKSIVRPPSHCPKCRKPIQWWDNIPLISYVLLGGRCRNCRKSISWQYPLVEALTGAFLVLVFLRFNQSLVDFVIMAALAIMSVLVSGIDIRTYTIPDKIILPFLVFAVLLAPFNPFLGDQWFWRLAGGAVGFIVGGVTLYVVGWVGGKFFKKEAMGGGDIKLLAAFGILLGWQIILEGLLLGSLLGGLVAVGLLLTGRLKRKSFLPFGPFICAGCLLVVFFERLRFISWFYFFGY